MRSPFKASSRLTAPLVLATAAVSFLALHCSSDEGGGGGTTAGSPTTSGTGGQVTGGSSTGGTTTVGGSSAGMTTGGVATAGAAGTASPGGGGAGGSAGGSGGAGGAGGAGGSTAGSAGSSGSGGGTGVTFTQVKALLAMSCKGSKCHDPGNEGKQADWITSEGLYTRLTTPLPETTAHCVGNTPIVPNMPTMSLLVQAVTGPGKITCMKKGGGTEMIARMPDDCPGDRPCLTPDQIKLITDWVAAGAPM